MPLSVGTRLGPYDILAPIGAGGMGEVYRGRDPKLDRLVAIKILPDALTHDPERLARFEREAKVLASLNHPNIAQIYAVEQGALVMELVEGETLKGPLALETALNYAKQIAEALEAAHEKGIIHRDLKPANIMITGAGVVKVLDFGLAKAGEQSPSDPQNSPTLTMSPTHAGMILGTAAYMSPEQARGKTVDKRADIWAFGCVLYEMLTGKQLFHGEAVSDILAAVLKEEPNLDGVPAKVRRLLERCLEKDPKKRLRDVGDWALLLTEPSTTAPSRSRLTMTGWIAAAVVIAIAAVLAFIHFREKPSDQVLRFTILPGQGTFAPQVGPPAVSPDGRHVAYVAQVDGKNELWVRDLDSLAARALVTEGVRFPFWSPDSRTVGYFSGGKLKKIDAAAGPALTLCDAEGWGGTWNRNGVILFNPRSSSGPLFRVAADGGSPTAVTTLDNSLYERAHHNPWFLPDGRHFLYTALVKELDKYAVYIGDLNSPERRRLMFTRSNAIYVSPGYLLYLREHTLTAQPFDAGRLEMTGDAFPIVGGVAVTGAATGEFAASQNGVLAFTSDATGGNAQLTWFDRSGKSMGTVGDPGLIQWGAISPDGKIIAFDRVDTQTGFYDIWLHDLARGTDSRFTFTGSNNFPVWSPDGSYIALTSYRKIYKKATSGTGKEEVVDQNDEEGRRPTDWSSDGRYLFEETSADTPRTSDDIWVAPMSPEDGSSNPYPYLRTEFSEGAARLSPNGKWLAYRSNETRRTEVYVMTFPNPGGKWQISTSGGRAPLWSHDGKELFFISANDKMMAVSIQGNGDRLEAGVPRALFDVRLASPTSRFDMARDGRFLIPSLVERNAVVPMTVVVNWPAHLKKE